MVEVKPKYHWATCPECGMSEAVMGGDPCPCGGVFECDTVPCHEPRCYLV